MRELNIILALKKAANITTMQIPMYCVSLKHLQITKERLFKLQKLAWKSHLTHRHKALGGGQVFILNPHAHVARGEPEEPADGQNNSNVQPNDAKG